MKSEPVMRTNTTTVATTQERVQQQDSIQNAFGMTEKTKATPNVAMTESGVSNPMVESGKTLSMESYEGETNNKKEDQTKENNNYQQGIITENGDGYITYAEAYHTYRLKEGKVDLFADLNKLDLSKIRASDFPDGVGSSRSFNFASSKYYTNPTQALVYGNITLHLLKGNKVVASSDIYDFDLKLTKGSIKRDVLTMMGHMVQGGGTPFKIHFRGFAVLKP